jgi:hypothetical protein
MSQDYYVVSADALNQLLNAVVGPAHYIRELQVTRNLPKLPGQSENPIDVLVKQVKMQCHLPTEESIREMRVEQDDLQMLRFTTNARTVLYSPNAAGLALKELEPLYCKSGGWKLPETKKES